MTLALLTALLLVQTPSTIADPAVPSRKANVDACTGGKACLDVKVVEGGGSSSGPSSVYVLDAGPPLNINPPSSLPLPTGASTEATLALIKAKTDNLDVALSSRTKPSDQQHALIDTPVTSNMGTSRDGGVAWPVEGFITPQLSDGGTPTSELVAEQARRSADLLELILIQLQQQTELISRLKEPGR